MNLHDLEKLEYNKILEKLSLYCNTYIGKAFAMELIPSSKQYQVQKLLNETLEAFNLQIRKGSIPIVEIADISMSVKKLESNLSLSAKSLLEIAHILKVSRELKDYFYKDENFELSNFPLLDNLFSNLYNNLDIEKSIFSSILDENTIADNASSKLSSLRRNRRKLESDIKENLNHILHSSNYSKAIMESIVTIRNDRYVIPVKKEFRGLIKGFIHDISSSGSTVFIEPMQVFELNNKIQSLKVEENAEIEYILEQLSSKITPYISEIKNNVSLIGRLDFTFAKANLAKNMDAICPTLNDEKIIDLKKARHPLIEKEKVVPIDIEIGNKFSSLIITGPNTGGKTVTLKTTGLLTLMACSGLFIPTEENSSIYVFDNVFADIGDEQSIQESLSTFSSHMTNIINITNQATSNSLVLIDELGSGTDPIEGANLAISILEYFHKLGCLTLTTTHYPEIKNYALVTDGFENASSAFDIENLKPTYQLLIGIPGKSNAFAISKKLGLPSSILERAESLLSEDTISVEELVKNIYDDKLLIEKEKEKILKNSNQVELLRKQLENNVSDVENRKNEIINNAKNEARNILISAKEEANDIIKELNNLYDSADKDALKKANSLRDNLNANIKNNLATNESDDSNNSNHSTTFEISVGMQVLVKPFNMTGTILTMPNRNNEVMVQFGSTKTKVKVSNLELIKNSDSQGNFNNKTTNNMRSGKSYSTSSNLKAKSVSTEINVIGENGFIGRGISRCAQCDGTFLKAKKLLL